MLQKSETPRRFRFSRDDYYRMAEVGIIPPDARVELLEGEIIEMSPIGSGHSAIVSYLDEFFHPKMNKRGAIRVQNPLTLDGGSEPEPDLVVVKPRDDYYRHAHPTPADVLLLIEVAESSIDSDLGAKLRLYAQANISEYWVFDLNRNVLITHRDPAGEVYQTVREFKGDDRVHPETLPDSELIVKEVFGE